MAQTDPAAVLAALKRARLRNEVVKSGMAPAMLEWQQEMYGRTFGAALPRDPRQFLDGTFTPLTPIQPVAINVPEGEWDRPEPRQRQMPPGWNMPVGEPGTEGFKLATFGTLRTYADIYSVARSCIQVRKGEIRGLEWDVMPTEAAEKKMRGDQGAHREFNERKKVVVRFFRKPDPDYLGFGSYIDALVEEMLVTDAMSLYLHPTQKKGGYGPFGKDVAALELISGSTIRPLVNNRGGRVKPPSPAYQQYLYGVPRVDLMQILNGSEADELKELGKPAKQYRADQLMYLPYTQRSWTPYGFPPLERTLIPTITGLRKQQFQLDYFDEGTIPGNYISPGENLGWTPNQLQIWQDQNNAIAGDPAWKHKSIALPPGSKVFPMRPVPLADQFDEIVMTQVCMGYDVMPMEMGISPKVSTTQSPGAANQMAKATEKTNERKSLKPTLSFLTDIFNVLIQVVWGQEDMRFVFEGLEEDEDENALIERLVQMLQYGLASIDECRIALKRAPWGLPITSDPVYVNPTAGMVPLGSIDPLTGKPIMGAPAPAAIGAPPQPGGGQGGPPGVGGAPKPAPALPGAPKPAGGPGGAPPAGPPSGGGPSNPADSLHPDDKVGQARQATAERHADLQDKLHEDFASGKPMEPPVRPPVSQATEDPEHPQPGAKRPSTKAMISELQAMTRLIVKNGRDPGTWEPRALPPEVLDYHRGLLKHLSPQDAAAVTTDFIVLCFGPSTLVAELEQVEAGVKTFSTAVPLDATDGRQGLAPLSMDDGSPSVCSECGEPVDGRVHYHRQTASINKPPTIDNGATADPGPNGVTKAAMSDPKEPLPLAGRVTRAWPGWRYDLRLAAIYAERLSAALGDALDPEGVAVAWLESQALPGASVAGKGALGPLGQIAWSWLESRGFAKPIRDAIQRVLTNIWTEGFAVGRESAREMADPAYGSPFWDNWEPGDPDAARLTAGPGLQKLLQSYGIATIRSVHRTRMTQLASVLADGFTKGDSPDQIAKDIEPVLRAPQRARMIAVTELARATTQAAIAEYREAGFEGKSWSVTGIPPDNRVCPRCKKNGAQGSIPMSQPFDTGDEFTPAHPECRCAILPEELPADTFNVPGVLKQLITDPAPTLADALEWQAARLKNVFPRFTKEQVHFRAATSRAHSCVTCAMWTATPHEDDPPAGKCDFGFFADADDTCDKWTAKAASKGEPVAGGLAVRARDTGRVLMIQRAHNEDDPAGGYWEFPGGRLEPGEDVGEAAKREWMEETGLPLPAGRVASTWDAGNYRGHVLPVDSEDACPILDREKGANPDDPDNEAPEAIAWWDPAELRDNPAIRPELQKHPKRVRRALEATGDKVHKGVLAQLATALDQQDGVPTGQVVYDQLLENYPPDSIEWVQRAEWRGPYLVSWNLIDHDDMDSWAASHEPEHVDRFARKIEAGEHVNPVVLVLDEGGTEDRPDFIDVDGHHRALAYRKLKRPIRAWVGRLGSPADRKAMELTHLDQVHEGASLLNKSAGPAAALVTRQVLTKSWRDAWRHELRGPDGRWIRSGEHIEAPAAAGGSVTFRVRTSGGATDHETIESARAKQREHSANGIKSKIGYAPGHDARHVSLLTDAVRQGRMNRAQAMLELSHAPKLQEKLARHLDGSAAPRPKPGPDPDEARFSKQIVDNFAQFYRDAADKDSYMSGYSKKLLEELQRRIKAELDDPGTTHERAEELWPLRAALQRELDRKAGKIPDAADGYRPGDEVQINLSDGGWFSGTVSSVLSHHEVMVRTSGGSHRVPTDDPARIRRPEPKKPAKDPWGVMIVQGIEENSHDAAQFKKYLKGLEDVVLAKGRDELQREFSEDNPDIVRRAQIRRLKGSIENEIDRRAKAQRRKEDKLRKEAEQADLAKGVDIHSLVSQARQIAEDLLGIDPSGDPNHGSNHRTTVTVPKQGNEDILASMGWDGQMELREDVVANLARIRNKDHKAPLNFHEADTYQVILHELFHSIGQGQRNTALLSQNTAAYQRKLQADIEEGMTEIGAATHAAEFVDALGVGDTPTFAGNLRNLATMYGLNSNLDSGGSWGHYASKVTRQYRWLQKVASLPAHRSLGRDEASRVKALVKEISRSGVEGKLGIMAEQLVRGYGLDPDANVPGTETRMRSAAISNLGSLLGQAARAPAGTQMARASVVDEEKANPIWDQAFTEMQSIVQAWEAAS